MRTARAPSSIAANRVSMLSRSAQPGLGPPPRRALWSRIDGADRRGVRRRLWVVGRPRACHATMPVDERARQALRPLTTHAAEMAERSTAGTLDLAFRHADSPRFEGEAPSVALACAVWGPLIGGKSARRERNRVRPRRAPRIPGVCKGYFLTSPKAPNPVKFTSGPLRRGSPANSLSSASGSTGLTR